MSDHKKWFVLLPVIIAMFYGSFFSLFRPAGSGWRFPAIQKVFFDHTFYLTMVSKDAFHAGSILPTLLRPWELVIRATWPSISLAEWYIFGVIVSACLSIWLFARLLMRFGGLSLAQSRIRSLALFLSAQVILVLRPGGPSWYVPFFLAALLLVWTGETYWEKAERGRWRSYLAWFVACIFASVYPWYLLLIMSLIGALWLFHVLRPRFVIPGIIIALLGVLAAVLTQASWIPQLISSQLAVLAVRNGFAWSYLPVLGNTMIVIVFWCVLWTVVYRTHLSTGASAERLRSCRILLFVWVMQFLLWFQSSVTGFSIVPDHFIYTVWLLAVLSCAVLLGHVPLMSPFWKRVFNVGRCLAAIFVISIFVRMLIGPYRWTDLPSLVIHLSIWLSFIVSLTQRSRRGLLMLYAFGLLVMIWGALSVYVTAQHWAMVGPPPERVREWFVTTHPAQSLRWCTDAQSAEYLYANTDQAFYPAILEKQESVPLSVLQERLIELAGFFHVRASGQLFIWDDMILNDEDFACRVFGPARAIIHRLSLSKDTKLFLIGCDEAAVEEERAHIIKKMDDRWTAPMPTTASWCDGFVVRSDLEPYWRIPPSYRPVYQGVDGSVYERF